MSRDTYALSLGGERFLLRSGGGEVWEAGRHCHAEYELHIVLRGAAMLTVKNLRVELKAGEAALIAPGQYHSAHSLPGEFVRLSISFPPPTGALAEALRSRVTPRFVLRLDDDTAASCRALSDESAANLPYRDEMIASLLSLMMISLLRRLRLPEGAEGGASGYLGDDRVSVIDDFFERNLDERRGEESLAARAHLSKRQLARVLLDSYGMNYRQKLLQARMDHAAHLLRTSDRKITEICESVGYASESAFFKVFRRYYQTTPLKYRAACRASALASPTSAADGRE